MLDVHGIARRFWGKVRRGDGCWLWLAHANWGGYGFFRVGSKMELAHRVSWVLLNGQIPADLWVLHKCDNRLCVNPAHLFLGTHADNMRDMAAKGRGKSNPHAGTSSKWAKLTDADVLSAIRRVAAGESRRAVAKSFGVDESSIRRIVKGLSYKSSVAKAPSPADNAPQ